MHHCLKSNTNDRYSISQLCKSSYFKANLKDLVSVKDLYSTVKLESSGILKVPDFKYTLVTNDALPFEKFEIDVYLSKYGKQLKTIEILHGMTE